MRLLGLEVAGVSQQFGLELVYIYIYVDTGKSHVCITSRNKNATQALMEALQNRLKSIKLFTTWTSGIYIKQSSKAVLKDSTVDWSLMSGGKSFHSDVVRGVVVGCELTAVLVALLVNCQSCGRECKSIVPLLWYIGQRAQTEANNIVVCCLSLHTHAYDIE